MLPSLGNTLTDFKKIDWTFHSHSSSGHITSLHPYPARFIPIIPRTIMNGFNLEGRKLNILDPFAGCGTTLVEGLDLGHNVVGLDINGLAALLERVYCYPYTKSELEMYKNNFEKILLAVSESPFKSYTVRIPNIDHWFNNDAQRLLYAIIKLVNKNNVKEEIRDLIKFALSRIIVKISNQQSDTQYRAINKKLTYEDMVNIVGLSLVTVYKLFVSKQRNWKGSSRVVQGDSREALAYKGLKDIDLVITSPPYPNAYEYWLYHKYRMFWLNMDPLWCRSREIGARPFYSGSGKMNEFDFQVDLEKVFKQIHKVSHRDTIQFWVVGDSVIKGRVVDNSLVVSEACSNTGWKIIDKIDRKMTRSRSSFQGIGRQSKEELLVITRND